MDNHTPGPWSVNDYGFIDADGEEDAIEVITSSKRGTEEANLRLIAAAPDLLEALEFALPMVEHYHEREGASATLYIVKRAIAKAKGE
jgi:hypothetical protein